MPEAIIIAIIGVVGSLLGAAIGAFGTIYAAKAKAESEGKNAQSGRPSYWAIGLVASVAGVLGLALGALFATALVQQIRNPSEPVPQTIQQPPGEQPPEPDCIAKEQGPLSQDNHTFPGPVHVVQLWRQNSESPWGDDEVMTVVVGDVSIIGAGGNVWTYPSAECEAVARIHMLDGAKARGSIVVTEEEMREAGLIR